MLPLAAALSILIGLVLGLLGGGGSILMLPLLVHVLHLGAREAIASSLLVVGATSLVCAVAHARAGRVRLRVGALFGAAAMGGAYLGGRLARFVPGALLLLLFGGVMLLSGAAMLRPRPATRGPVPAGRAAIVRVLGVGGAVGVLSGLVGVGGGFLIVPALVLLGGLTMPEAVGTSLLVIALQCAAGLAGQLAHTRVDLALLGVLGGASVAGSLAGAAISRRVRPDALRRGFAYLVLVMGVLFTGSQLYNSLLAWRT